MSAPLAEAEPAPSGAAGAALVRLARLPVRFARTLWASVGLARRARALRADGHRARAALFAEMSRRFLAIYGVEVRIRGALPEGPAILVPNHLGYLDPLAIGALGGFSPIAKSEVGAWPYVGAMGRAVGVNYFVRGDPMSGFRVLRRAARVLRSGTPVLNFAEGTTTVGDRVLPFRRGVFGLARRLGVPVVPIRLRFERRDLAWIDDAAFLPHFLDFASRPGERVSVEVLEPLDPGRFGSAEALAEATRAAVERGAVDPAPPLPLAS